MFDTDETLAAAPPQLEPHDFEKLQEVLKSEGPLSAADWLCAKLESNQDYPALFYALLMKKRIELGISPFPAGPSSDIPREYHEAYEEAIRTAGRKVGELFLAKNDFPRAWTYFNMLGETQLIVDALEKYEPGPEENIQPLIEVALYHQVNIPRGFDLIVDRYGICNAITTYSGFDFSKNLPARQHCIQKLVRSLHAQLVERIRNDLETRGETVPAGASIPIMLEGREYLFEDGAYHIDTSHLNSIVEFSLHLENCPELNLASELALYGSRLSGSFQNQMDPPFENSYADYKVYLDILRGVDVEAGLKHFRDKIDPAFSEEFTLPAEIYVNLLLRLGRMDEARAIAKKYLSEVQGRQMACPGVYELCLQVKDFQGLSDAARSRADGVSFLAALASQ
ncbi:hypothetical protein KIH39_11270 [Telmatocola sphagniphila]|uniref:Uncharacterized protein n=1 Tax=Telmatocola sphagniphila TaxID=1123043 RepID=A0A8E6B9Y4_9BACT|nr:hypothetical protein [Telmatocola sphagniphila]QVL34456.1 hypothetical protein KIH39_11270 [Telmatocola sphagniphila]